MSGLLVYLEGRATHIEFYLDLDSSHPFYAKKEILYYIEKEIYYIATISVREIRKTALNILSINGQQYFRLYKTQNTEFIKSH